MSRTVYVNGAYVPEEEAKVSVFDRGFLFADGVYEVTSVLEGKLIDFPGHLRRLHRSLDGLEIVDVHERRLDPEAGQMIPQKRDRPAVDDLRRDDVLARFDGRHQCSRRRAHSRSGRERIITALEHRDGFLEGTHGWIRIA